MILEHILSGCAGKRNGNLCVLPEAEIHYLQKYIYFVDIVGLKKITYSARAQEDLCVHNMENKEGKISMELPLYHEQCVCIEICFGRPTPTFVIFF